MRIFDAAHLKIGYVVDLPYDEPIMFATLNGVKEYIKKMGVKEFIAFDRDDEDNFITIKTMYADRYRESDIEDRLLANKSGDSNFFKNQKYK